jgi:serine phosphatase RsbU (regulator of sigma subunit)
MNRKILLLALFFAVFNTVAGQINRYGVSQIRNFSPGEYGASEQNWSIVQDRRGVMYFGNNDRGVLEFDGQNWRNIPVPNNSPVRSLSVNEQGTIYVGAVGELGYLAPDHSGLLKYHSLVHLIDSAWIDFSDIWKTHTLGEKVFFSSRARLYIYENDTIRMIRHRPEDAAFMSFLVDGNLYYGTYNAGLLKLDDDSFIPVTNGDFFIHKDIMTVLPYGDDDLLVGTAANGVYLYNKTGGEIRIVLSDESQGYLKENILYHGTSLSGGYYTFATLFGGAVIIDPSGNTEQIISTGNGLRDEMISSVFSNNEKGREGPLWLTMNNGIASLEIHNPVRSFGEESGLRGIILDVIRYGNRLYVATTSGVFYLEYSGISLPVFRQIEEIRHASWSFAIARLPGRGERLVIGTQGGVYQVDTGNRVTSITESLPETAHNCFSLLASDYHPGRIYLGLTNGLEYIEFKNGKWNNPRINYGFVNEIRNMKEDQDGNLWLGTHINGLIRLEFTEAGAVARTYGVECGLPGGLKNIEVHRFGDRFIFTTEKGIYSYDQTTGNFFPDREFENAAGLPETGISKFITDPEGLIWVSAYDHLNRWIATLSRTEDNSFGPEEMAYRQFPSLWCDVIYPDQNELVWFGISNTLFSFDKNISRDYHQPFDALIRKVTISHIDSILFNGTNFVLSDTRMLVGDKQPPELKRRLDFSNNRLEFEFASPFYDSNDKTEFSWFLEGEDRAWTNWSGETKAQYTYLREGNYTFRVKARNVYGHESRDASYEFSISPPLHRTAVAYISYVLFLALFIRAIVTFNSRRLKREKIILEGIVRDRTAEIMKQKEEIAEQNKNITDSIEYARRIQTALLPPGDYLKELLPQRFILFLPRDIVSGDFYWINKLNNRIIAVAADCTGHGVPGGFMSMLGVAFLNEIVNKSDGNLTAGQILDLLRDQVIRSLHQTGKSGEQQDGMDISLFILDQENLNLEFAGANNTLIIIRNGELIEIKGDKMPIGIHDRADNPFTTHLVGLMEGDVIYTFSDGYQDQFGGPKGKKFMIKQLKQLLLGIYDQDMTEQRDILEKELLDWQGSYERVDDIIVMGVRV